MQLAGFQQSSIDTPQKAAVNEHSSQQAAQVHTSDVHSPSSVRLKLSPLKRDEEQSSICYGHPKAKKWEAEMLARKSLPPRRPMLQYVYTAKQEPPKQLGTPSYLAKKRKSYKKL